MAKVKKMLSSLNDDQKHKAVQSPQVKGEQSASGSMSDPESDDDVLENAHEMGLYSGATEEHPQELNLVEELQKKNEH